ncbi:MAG: hypothetical protein A2066_10035 [Bacteroidetes bacterium GWB2_41_8]|nr:MAG: hypothetical protein A2066_10035 [Bacteroidetes bacterium GWB2_41_8]
MQFRTKARAVDLLGKGQIADLPTAITELWKNGYDAYADKLTAEIFRKGYLGLEKDLFLLTDDGKGMSAKDILDKWLVLGTDSKSRAELEDSPDLETLWKNPRIKAGEKGIGRLSVAFLGSPMLMMTKKIGSPIQLLFFDWRLLENFNLYLDDIIIPVQSLESIEQFDIVFKHLKESFLKNFDKERDIEENPIWEEKQLELKSDIISAIADTVLPDDVINKLFDGFSDIKESHGTKFLIFEPINQILELADENKEDSRENRDFIISSLSGFFNPFIEIWNRVNTFFYIHEVTGYDKDLLNQEGNFFISADYDLADILIEGKFDGNGSFKGSLRIYNQESVLYDFSTNRRKFKKKFYGEINLKLGYIVGEQKDSILNESAWKKINDKVSRNGGLYLFRDNFRILPYGRSNADFLKFEERRSKRIGTYFFSYRRMFGYLGLTRNNNPELKDKSSREGLINNDPYSAFESDLIAFFIQVAKDYFSDKAEKSIFLDEKKKLNEQNQAIADDKKRETEEKKAFSRSLSDYPEKFKKYSEKYSVLLKSLDEKVSLVDTTYKDIENLLDELNKLEVEYERLLPVIPKRYKPTELQLDRLNQYEDQIVAFNNGIKKNSKDVMLKVNEKLALHELTVNFTKNAEVYKNELSNSLQSHSTILRNKLSELAREYEKRSSSIMGEFNVAQKTSLNKITSKEAVVEQSNFLKSEYDRLKSLANKTLLPLTQHINRLSFDIDEETLQGAYKAQYDQMKYQWSQVQDTAQLGIAVEIIDHEFNVLYSRINRMLQELNNFDNFNSNKEFQLLEKTFRSLEDKYNLLSPLYRINGAITKDISCDKIVEYVESFFAKQLKEENIILTASDSFKKHIISIKEPTLYTVIINIINNAVYWLRNSEKREIRFDYLKETKEILILNSGRKIEEHRLTKIFDLFYSNRPTGRGIGLYLAKQTLNENYFDVEATNQKEYNYLNGACFVIKPLSD